MSGFSDSFESYLNADVSSAFDEEAIDFTPKTFVEVPPGDSQAIAPDAVVQEFYYFRKKATTSAETTLDTVAKKLIETPGDAAEYLDQVASNATTDPYKAFGILSTFGEVIKHIVAKIRRVPETLGVVFEKLRGAVAAVAKALEAATYSVNLNLPWSFGIGISWTPAGN